MTSAATLIEKYRLHEKDTGSAVFQIILLSQKIEKEQFHLVKNKKDVPAKRAIVKKNARRKRFYQYLIKNDPEIFQKLQKENKDLVKFLGIKG
jgi:small subunit ribosomal protein S15